MARRSGPLSKLDAWTIVERTTKETAKEAVGLDLRELALNDVDEIGVCSSLQVVLLSANLFQQLSPNAFFQCTRLKKLDLARNGITALPDRNVWGQLRELVVLYLHFEDGIVKILKSRLIGNVGGARVFDVMRR